MSSSLVKMPPIQALMGACLRPHVETTPASIYMYAPYKQAIAHTCAPGLTWVGDGAAILEKNWRTTERVELLRERAKVLGVPPRGGTYRVGARPYVEGFKAGYFKKVMPNTWVSTGGAKNGLVLAAYQAQLFLEAIHG